MDHKAPDAFRTISEVAVELELPQHVLRFWESRFREIKPMKRGGGRRYYRPDDVDLLRGIRHLLYSEGYTIRGVQRILREQGSRFVEAVWRDGAPQPPHVAGDDDGPEEVAVAEQPPEQKRGLLSRLIGRDAGQQDADPDSDYADESAEHLAPPSAAPELRVAPADRVVVAEPLPQVPHVSPPSVVSVPRQDEIGKLHVALHELAECRRLIDAVLARQEQ